MSYNPFTLEGKTVLVTGASSGIGRSTAIECSKMGATVILTARNEERLQETLSQMEGDGHQYIVADLLQTEDLERIVATVSALDGVVLCAGKGLTLPFNFSSRDKFDSIFEVNFFSPVELLRLLNKKKKIATGGSVVMMDSIGGVKRFAVGNSIYGASKAALKAMVNFCAVELATRKIRVNGVCPGMVETPLIRQGTLTEEQLKMDMDKYPLKRYGTPEEVAYGVIYLLSDASAWVTGHSLIIDGGITAK